MGDRRWGMDCANRRSIPHLLSPSLRIGALLLLGTCGRTAGEIAGAVYPDIHTPFFLVALRSAHIFCTWARTSQVLRSHLILAHSDHLDISHRHPLTDL